MKTARQELVEAIKATGGLKSASVGSKMFVYSPALEAQVEAEMRALSLRTGDAIVWKGQKEFYAWVPWQRAGCTGSERYVWHRDGNRVKHDLILHVVKDGEVTKTTIKSAWRKLV